jgi:hypothetical protein
LKVNIKMEQPKNIEIFNRVVLLTLVKLYESFPVPINVDSGKIGYEAAHDAEDVHEAFETITAVASSSISFLVEEGFLRYEPSSRTMSGPDFPGARLTLKGFTLLGSVPSTVDGAIDRRPFADQLHSVVNDGAKSSIAEFVKSLLAGSVQLGVSALAGM